MGVTINNLAKKAYKKFIAEGATKEGVCGFLGNVFAESGMSTSIVEWLCLQRLKENGKNYTQDTYYKAVDSGKISRAEFLNPLPGKQYGFGWTQLTTPVPRKSEFYDRTVAVGKSIADEDAQIEYSIYELKNRYKSVWKILTTTHSVKEASDAVLRDFEAPNNWQSQSSTRLKYANDYYNYFKNETTTTQKGSDTVAVYELDGNMISNSGSDEYGGYTGGQAGDQNQKEWRLMIWYSRPWNCVLRHPNRTVGNKISELAIKAAKNDKIGYDQGERYTYWSKLQAANYDPSKITAVCESDCSAGVIANTKAAGYILGIDKLKNIWATYTGNMRQAYKEAGFEVLTDSKYLNGPDYLLPGDILLNDVHHVATCVSTGSKVKNTTSSTTTSSSSSTLNEGAAKWTGKTNQRAYVRKWAGSEYDQTSFSPLQKNVKVEVLDTVKDTKKRDWYFVRVNGKTGFVFGQYIDKVTDGKKAKQYRVQGGTYNVLANANASCKTYINHGFDAVVVKSTTSTAYVVQLGLFDELSNAEAYKNKLRENGFTDVVIVAMT